jgi:hypothetical protein
MKGGTMVGTRNKEKKGKIRQDDKGVGAGS